MNQDDGWNTQTASDIIRDGLGVELLAPNGAVVAEVFRCDADNSVSVTCWSPRITDEVLAWFLPFASKELAAFEDGSSLPHYSKWVVS